MNISQGSLVIIGANTPECKVFWNGQEAGIITQTIVEAKLIDDTYFLVKLG